MIIDICMIYCNYVGGVGGYVSSSPTLLTIFTGFYCGEISGSLFPGNRYGTINNCINQVAISSHIATIVLPP